jgi:hypothetical protein
MSQNLIFFNLILVLWTTLNAFRLSTKKAGKDFLHHFYQRQKMSSQQAFAKVGGIYSLFSPADSSFVASSTIADRRKGSMRVNFLLPLRILFKGDLYGLRNGNERTRRANVGTIKTSA